MFAKAGNGLQTLATLGIGQVQWANWLGLNQNWGKLEEDF